MNLKKIKAMPFAAFKEENRVRWKVTVKEPVVDGERLLVVDFLENESCTAYKRDTPSFRIVCGKKSGEVKGITHEGKVSDGVLQSLYGYSGDYVLISEREEKALARFMGKDGKETGNHQIDNLAGWVFQTKKEMKKRERQKRGELMDEDYRLCPETLPEGLEDYIRREILPQDRTLVYKKGNVRGTCFCCGRQVRAWGKRFLQHIHVQCPDCGEMVICVLETSNSYIADYVGNVVAVQKGTDGETVFFRQWQIQRDMSAQWNDLPRYLKETARYAIRGNKTAKWQKEGKDNYFMRSERYSLKEWTRWGDNRIYDGAYYFFTGGMEEALHGTAMQYADIRGYLNQKKSYTDPVHFLEYHAKYPVIEFLWKAGYRKLANERIFGMTKENRNAIRWQRETVKECFKFPIRLLGLKEPGEWSMDDIEKLSNLWTERENNLTEKEIIAIFQSDIDVKMIRCALPYAGAIKILNYIEKQAEETCLVRTEAMVYRDYLQECEQLHLDLSNKEILFPKDLRAAHNRTMEQIKFEKNKADQEKFQKAVESLEKFAWKNGNFIIRPARAQEELQHEGTALHHCVGGYIKRMAEGETAIFFIRRASDTDKPFYTLELKKKKVIQCRTLDNKSYEQDPEIKAFVDAWIEKVVMKGGNKKKAKEAAA
ncbi:MAG: PcfJ domain-containing protein [Anaerotignum sp.]|nr:PcfJ domain-containing protein [Anaerotignum sp.]MDY3927352.1 PcfJ domain-containing protein [Anaerotignum sp.]